jgi:hypothetical protein
MTTLSPDNLVVQGFWSGPITTMERLCIASFLQNGHRFDLYTYNPREVQSVPPGNVHIKDAREILPESEIVTFRCVQQLSDFFRISLLLKKGGWYVDLDEVCLRPFEFETDYVFYRDYDESTISFAVSKAPLNSPIMAHCHQYLSAMSIDDRACISWQEIGSEFAVGAVEFFHLTAYAQPGYVFDPVHWTCVYDLVNPEAKWDLSKSYAVHLFHAAWNDGPVDRMGKGFDLGRKSGPRLDTNDKYHPDCLYEQLKKKYGL